MSTTTRKSRVLRGFDANIADFGTVKATGYQHLVVDPEVVQMATDEGYRVGYQSGFDAALADAAAAIDSRERQRSDDLRRVIETLSFAAGQLAEDHADIIAEMEPQIVALAIELASIIVGHDVAAAANPGADALQRALQLAPGNAPCIARLNPDDFATFEVSSAHDDYVDRGLSVMPDPTLQRGDCIVDIDSTRIDARLQPALERLREVLAS